MAQCDESMRDATQEAIEEFWKEQEEPSLPEFNRMRLENTELQRQDSELYKIMKFEQERANKAVGALVQIENHWLNTRLTCLFCGVIVHSKAETGVYTKWFNHTESCQMNVIKEATP